MKQIVFIFLACIIFVNCEGGWIWIDGSNTISSNGKYSSILESNNQNVPSARSRGTTWKDVNGFWLFGGYGYDSEGKIGMLETSNDKLNFMKVY